MMTKVITKQTQTKAEQTNAKQILKVNFKNRVFNVKTKNLIFALVKLGYDEKEIKKQLATAKDTNEYLKKYGLYNEVFLERINELIV